MGSIARLQLWAASDSIRLSGPALPSPRGRIVDVMDLLKI